MQACLGRIEDRRIEMYDRCRPGARTHEGTVARIFACAISLWLTGNRDAEAQTVRQDFYATDGEVRAAALSGGTLYIGGAFHLVGPARGGGVPSDAATGL